MVILKLKDEMKIFLLEKDIILKSTNCQEAGADADKIRNNLLLLAEESNYRLHIECLYLQWCLPSHLI